MKTSFYIGRPTRGAKLIKVGSVIWDGRSTMTEPFKRDDHGIPIYRRLGYYSISKREGG